MNILIVKTSSLGDIVHFLPAIEDARRVMTNLHIDWLVEENFTTVAQWHPSVQQVFPVALRRWRKALFSKNTWQEAAQLKELLQEQAYDMIIDAQGLVKSAYLSQQVKRYCGGEIYGYDKNSIREPFAARFYDHHLTIDYQQHAITRNRLLMAESLSYALDDLILDYGIQANAFIKPRFDLPETYIVCLHGTSKVGKEWPEAHWVQLIKRLAADGIHLLFPWGNAREEQRALRLASHSDYAHCLPRCDLSELAYIMQRAKAVIGMDTGLMHIAAALNKTGIGLYPMTQPALTGLLTGGETNRMQNLSANEAQAVGDIADQLMAMMD
ncbi:MAG TPA: lipopolysaccharide heptosyltransferase I [Thiothrix sp.]|nr:lipopolysaccharide heptosyltransferase I [Thiothrix sp.]